MDGGRIEVLEVTPCPTGGFDLKLDCWHLTGPDATKVQHWAWRRRPVKYVMHCDECEEQEELQADYWSSVL